MIWNLVSLHPRIVHLSKKRLAVDNDPNWWRSVRSDKAIAVPSDDCESDYGSVDDEEIDLENVEQQIAAKRLLTPDVDYKGSMSRAAAKVILQRPPQWRLQRPLVAGLDCPKILYGLRSESPVPGILLACRESFEVSSRVYSRAFGTLGGAPQTWFNYRRDTLYLDGLTNDNTHSYPGLEILTEVLEGLFVADELARIENFAIHRGPYGPSDTFRGADAEDVVGDFSLYYFLQILPGLIPNIKQLTIVDGHYAHQDRTITKWERSGEQYVDLKFMQSVFDSEFCWRVNGFRIDAALLRGGIHPEKGPIQKELEKGQRYWDNPGEGASWKPPKTNIEVIVSSSDEERLLHDAYLFEIGHNKGCW